MATNKNASIRYNVLDKCFRNPRRKYFIENLIKACNDALIEYSGVSDGVKKRQIFEDIKFMESEQGWAIPLERYKDGKKVYYRYSDLSFSINKQVINENEASQLKETLSMLSRFKGMPQFEWVEELTVRLESEFNLQGNRRKIVDFEQNLYLKGIEFFTAFFNAIVYKTPLKIKYKNFKNENVQDVVFHPYYLKQYNSRWFVFGLNDSLGLLSNYALDRVLSVNEARITFKENDLVDFETYFDDCIGVTLPANSKPEKLLLQVGKGLWPYIQTKPIHGSQKTKEIQEFFVVIELDIIINFELISLLFSFGDQLKVIAPESLSTEIKRKALLLAEKYS